MSDLQIGTEVTIKSFIGDASNTNPVMRNYEGRFATITSINLSTTGPFYRLDVDNGKWSWNKEHFDLDLEASNKINTLELYETTKQHGLFYQRLPGHLLIKNSKEDITIVPIPDQIV